MQAELWQSFPRLFEQRFLSLLDSAHPTSEKTNELYKALKLEGLLSESREHFQARLQQYYSIHRSERRKSHLDYFLNRPMPQSVFSSFELSFQTAEISEENIHHLANWSHNMIRLGYKRSSDLISTTTLKNTILHLLSQQKKNEGRTIEFSDFCHSWAVVVENSQFQNASAVRDEFLNLLNEFKRIDQASRSGQMGEVLQLIEVREAKELAWVKAIRLQAFNEESLNAYPFQDGPFTQFMKELLRTAILYNLAIGSKKSDLLSYQQKIRTTLLHKCDLFIYDHENFTMKAS